MQIISEIIKLIEGYEYKIKLHKVREQNFISIGIKENDYNKIISIWDNISEKVDKLIDERKHTFHKHVKEAIENLVIEVDRLENV